MISAIEDEDHEVVEPENATLYAPKGLSRGEQPTRQRAEEKRTARSHLRKRPGETAAPRAANLVGTLDEATTEVWLTRERPNPTIEVLSETASTGGIPGPEPTSRRSRLRDPLDPALSRGR